MGRHVTLEHLGELRQESKQLQLAAIQEFTGTEEKRQDDALKNRLAALQASLLEDIEIAHKVSLPEIAPIQLPEDVQFKLSNLQLRLGILTNMQVKNDAEAARVAAQKNETQAQIDAINGAWAQQLQKQQYDRLAEVDKMQVELPARMRQTGEARIQQIGATAVKAAASEREEVIEGQRTLAAADFGAAGGGDYAIDLPGATLSGRAMNLESATNRVESGSKSTTAVVVASPGNGQTMGGGGNSAAGAQPQALRASAMFDAIKWVRIAVHRAGWRLPEEVSAAKRPTTIPDRTVEVLHLLHL